MALQVSGQVGAVASGDGSQPILRMTRNTSVVVADGQGRYTEANKGGNIFTAANTAVQALSTNSTTATGLILTNPIGSGKIVSLLNVAVALASLPAGQASLLLSGGYHTSTAVTQTVALTPRSAYIGAGGTPVGLAASSATLPTAAGALGGANIYRIIPCGVAATVAASTAFPPAVDLDLAGQIALYPGSYISLQCLTTAISVQASMVWEEYAL